MNIHGREIGAGHPPYIIAEISGNHGGSLTHALELIDAAKSCGADSVKFQCFEANTITLDCRRPEFTVQDGPWKGHNLHELYERTETPFDWFPQLKARADKVGITWFSSCFDKTSVDLMVKLGAPAIKIASFEIVDLPLIRYAARTGKPLILSTGMASDDEIVAAAEAASNCAILHCVSGYPTSIADADLMRMTRFDWWRDGREVGISDHTVSIEVPIAATAMGASIIEKHFCLSWHPDTEDTPFSLDEVDFFEMTKMVRNTWAAMQEPKGDPEAAQRPFRRSLFAVEDIKAGGMFDHGNVRSIRPGHGLPPAAIDQVIGRTAARDIKRGEPLSWDMLEVEQQKATG